MALRAGATRPVKALKRLVCRNDFFKCGDHFGNSQTWDSVVKFVVVHSSVNTVPDTRKARSSTPCLQCFLNKRTGRPWHNSVRVDASSDSCLRQEHEMPRVPTNQYYLRLTRRLCQWGIDRHLEGLC